ncbi:hypothetical protein NMY22_g12684 [Coprinellus aureogranulatus]|nr:hypothetical protein NMY22_g12684 [Coprinellus aureogranulatus]
MPFLCHNCERTFKAVPDLQTHCKAENHSPSFVRECCGRQFSAWVKWDLHVAVSHVAARVPRLIPQLIKAPNLKNDSTLHISIEKDCEESAGQPALEIPFESSTKSSLHLNAGDERARVTDSVEGVGEMPPKPSCKVRFHIVTVRFPQSLSSSRLGQI